VKLFNVVSEDEILKRLRSWKDRAVYYGKLEAKIGDKSLCTLCGHSGRAQGHTKKGTVVGVNIFKRLIFFLEGCLECGTSQGCDSSKFENERLEIKNELNMRSKALADPSFPDEELVNEFLVKKSNVSELNLEWTKPDLINFVVSWVRRLKLIYLEM
jgi:hypothetical protein